MDKLKVYVETTIFSYYFDTRPTVAIHAERTRKWWDDERHLYECFASEVVVEELSDGVYPWQADALQLASTLEWVDMLPEVQEIAKQYWAHRLMPRFPIRDAVHVAAATYHGIDYLLTWNCSHLANANKTRQLEIINRRLGFASPQIITPLNLQPLDDML